MEGFFEEFCDTRDNVGSVLKIDLSYFVHDSVLVACYRAVIESCH